MPMLFFHATDGRQLVPDLNGQRVKPSNVAARAWAVTRRLEHSQAEWIVCVYDEAGRQLYTFTASELRVWNERQRAARWRIRRREEQALALAA